MSSLYEGKLIAALRMSRTFYVLIICFSQEVEFLQKRDIEGNIKFTDLNDLDYDPSENGDVSFEAGMKVIHAILPDGSTVKGVEVFRRVYDVIGLGWVYAATKLPGVGWLADTAYDMWAINRLK